MLHNRQAPGRDFHKHFSLAPARSDTNPPSNPQSAPAPSPLQDRAQARNATSRAPHLSLIPLAPPAPPRLRPLPPLDSLPSPLPPCPPSTSTKGRLERHPRGREGHRQVSPWDVRERPHLNHNATHPDPSGPAQPYVLSDCRTPEPVSVPGALPCMAMGRRRWCLRASCAMLTCLRSLPAGVLA